MMRSTCLAALLLAAGCFSEPSSASTSDAGDDDTGSGTTSMDGSSTEAGDEGSTTFWFGSSTTGLFFTSTGFDTTGTDTGDPPSPLLDLYEQCNLGQWQASDGVNALESVSCLHVPMDENVGGGGWQYPFFPADGEPRVLILHPYPVTGGEVQASFNTGDLGIPDGATLQFDYAYVNTAMPGDDVGTMTFEVSLRPPDPMPGAPLLVQEMAQGTGTSGSFQMALDVLGPADDVVFRVASDTFVPGQGVALMAAAIYDAP